VIAPDDTRKLEQENAYLRQRNAQLQADLTDLQAEVHRLTQTLERSAPRRADLRPNPLAGGQ
jgi:cell division protein FtsB